MGIYLTKPITNKFLLDEKINGYSVGTVSMQGWRKRMEDCHVLRSIESNNSSIFCVFDGHCGREVAKFCERHFTEILEKTPCFINKDYAGALTQTYFLLDELLNSKEFAEEIENFKDKTEVESETKTNPRKISTNENSFVFSRNSTAGDDDEQDENRNKNRNNSILNTNPQMLLKTLGSDPRALDKLVKTNPQAALLLLQTLQNQSKSTKPQATPSNILFQDDFTNTQKRKSVEEVQEGPRCTLPEHRITAGTTAVVVLLTNNQIITANAGDSRAILCRNGQVIELSHDHKPFLEKEKKRIEAAGGFLQIKGSQTRINGNLSVSRAIGDLKYKQNKNISSSEQIITCLPDISIETRDPILDEFLVIACDGVWDCISNEAMISFVRTRRGKISNSQICSELLDQIISPDPEKTKGIGADNMTCIIVDLN